jgi:hypothetical protein
MKKPALTNDESASQLIDARIAELGGWRGETLAHARALIRAVAFNKSSSR